MTRKSPVRAGRSTGTRRAARSRRAWSCWSSASSGTWGSARPTSSPVYPPRAALGRTWTVALKVSSPSSGTSSRSSKVVDGDDAGLAHRLGYQPPSAPLSISCTTASRPTRWTMTSAGAFPAGSRARAPRGRARARPAPSDAGPRPRGQPRRAAHGSPRGGDLGRQRHVSAGGEDSNLGVAPLGPKPSAYASSATPAQDPVVRGERWDSNPTAWTTTRSSTS